MSDKIKVAVSWAAACGGCDVSLLDMEDKILELAAVADIVYWPVATDFKRSDLIAYGPGEIDVGLFNGAIRTEEHAEDARLLRERCKVLIAYGACAAFGGIPGLANLSSLQEVLDTMYEDTASTDNPEGVRPATESEVAGCQLQLPGIEETVAALGHLVEVDYTVPGCPPPPERMGEAVQMIIDFANGKPLPPRGTVLASAKGLCDECERVGTKTGNRVPVVRRPHQVEADPELCFLEQGILCMGIATRGGCGSTCIKANMPCRGCFGPTPEMLDPGAEALSAIGSILAQEHEDNLIPGKRLQGVRSIADVAGTFYRFTLPSATIFRAVDDTEKGA
jgi:F420-non-reducing hydrogenase small subunit